MGLQVPGGGQVDLFLLPLFPGKAPLVGFLHLDLHGFRADLRRLRGPVAVNLPLDRACKGADKIRRFGDEIHPFLVYVQIVFFLDGFQLILHPVGGFLQQDPEPVRAELSQEFVRVLCVPHFQNLDLQPRLFQHGNGPLGGVLPRLVPVVDQNDLLGIPGKQGRVFLRQGSAQGGNRTVKAVLVEGNGIHIPFHQNQIPKSGFLGKIQGKQILPLVENLRLGRV